MKKLAKILSLILSLMLVFSLLTGCGSKSTNNDASNVNYQEVVSKLPTIKMLVGNAADDQENAAEIKKMIKENIGIEVEMVPVKFNDRLKLMNEGNYESALAGWGPDYNDPMTYLDMWITNSGMNDSKYSNSQFDKLIEDAKNESDSTKRMDLMAEAEKILLNDAIVAPYIYGYDNYVLNDKLKDVIISPTGLERNFYYASKENSTEININIDEEPAELNSALTTDTNSMMIMGHIMEGLTRIGKDGKPVPGVAESWDVNDSYTEFTFHLRDANWSNGESITANDFAYAWFKALEQKSPYTFILYPIKNAEAFEAGKIDKSEVGIQVIDEKTLKVTLEKPVLFFLELTSFVTYYPQNQKFVESNANYGQEANALLYNGPFIIEKWDHEKEMVWKKNPNYWNANAINLDKINFIMTDDVDKIVEMFFNGELDMIEVVGDKIEEVKSKGFVPTRYSNGSVFYLQFNANHDVLKNAKIRKAISLAINRQYYTDEVLKNGSIPAYGIIPDVVPGKQGTFRYDYGEVLQDDQNEEAKNLIIEGVKELGL